MKRVSIYTLGCKLNQSESASLMNGFVKRGYQSVPFGKECDVCIINTCTVTAKSDYRCRQIIRKASKISPKAIIAVVGCYAQTAIDTIKNISSVDIVLGSDKKFEIFDYLENNRPQFSIGDNKEFKYDDAGSYHGRSRALLKIQDGCDNRCSYCIVPLARGRSRSAALDRVVQNAHLLVQQGFKEIILTGVHIGSYGHDLMPRTTLVDLLKALNDIQNLERIRLSSLEPLEINDELIDFIAASPKICHHFHIPLQSGDDFILHRMRRNYSVKQYVDIVKKISTRIPDVGLGTDIIVGFPGESEDHFQNCYALINDLPFTYLHVFSFSPRAMTDAVDYSEKVEQHLKKKRSARLIQLGKLKKLTFYQHSCGNILNVLFEEGSTSSKWMFGFSDNYIRVKARKDTRYFNNITSTKIVDVQENHVIGEILM